RLQPPALVQRARVVGEETVEEAVVAVLGHIDDTGARIDDRGLAVEAPHRLQRLGLDQLAGIGGDVEYPAVRLGHPLRRPVDAFLAAQPAAPRRHPARTVADRT